MKLHSFLILWLLCTMCASAQVSKIYITSANKYSDDPVNAVSYILVSRTPDSLYLVKQFDMQDSITMEGSYKDNQLSIQQGGFKFYRLIKQVRTIRLDYTTKKTDTSVTPAKNYVYQKGSYIDGLQTGEWLDYDSDGNKTKLNTFRDGKLDGAFRTFGKNGDVAMQGQYVNGKQDGIWYTRTFKGDTSEVDYYSNGGLEKNISHWNDIKFKSRIKEAKSPYDPILFINKKLSVADKNYIHNCKCSYGAFSFTITADGQLTMPIIENVNNPSIDKRIVEAILSGGKWKPAEIDGKQVESGITFNITGYQNNSSDGRILVYITRPRFKDYNGY